MCLHTQGVYREVAGLADTGREATPLTVQYTVTFIFLKSSIVVDLFFGLLKTLKLLWLARLCLCVYG